MKEAGTVIVFLVSSNISSFRVMTFRGDEKRCDQEREGWEAPNQDSTLVLLWFSYTSGLHVTDVTSPGI